MAGVRPLKSLGPFTSDWIIKVRLTSKGKIKTFQKKPGDSSCLMPLEFVDEDGTQITATLFGRGVEKFDEILAEGKCYFISKGTVKYAMKKYTSIKNDYAITLDENSEIKLATDDESIRAMAFNFTPISRIKTMDNTALVDVIGIVSEVEPPTSITLKDGNKTMKRIINIYDESKDSISVTLWRELAEISISEKQIIGLKNVRVGEFKGKQLNTTRDTILTVNPNDVRTAALQAMYPASHIL